MDGIDGVSLPNLRHLRGFLTVAQEGGVLAGAQVLGLSQPALSQALANLETWVGIALFERNAHGVTLTEPGQVFRRRIARGIAFLERAVVEAGAPRHAARHLSVSQLRSLIAVVERGGFRAAARALGCAASTVNRSCRDLEGLLGAPLFEVTSAGLRGTVQAEEMVRLIRLALAEIGQGRDDIAAWCGAATGRLVIGSLPLAQASIVPQALAQFTEEFPLIRCSVMDGYYLDLARGLRRAGIDLIVGALRGADLPDDLEQTELFTDRLAVVARRGHPLEGRQGLGLDDLGAYGWIAPRTGAPARAYFDHLFPRISPCPDGPAWIETGAHSVMRGLLRSSDRITLISLSQVRDEIDHGLLCALDIPLPDSTRPIGYTVRADWLPGLPQRRFLDILHDVAIRVHRGDPEY